jgi:NAD(P)-dependent dehydrogenase (short-subunit alcohol dehydrogenase family)
LLDERANLAGKVAAVVGGAGAIGRQVAFDLASCGVAVAVCDADSVSLAVLEEDLGAAGAAHMSRVVDVLDADDLARFFADFDSAFQRLDILVNVVGGSTWLEFGETTHEQWAADMRLNLGYVIQSTHLALPRIRRGGGGGSIINFTTIEASRGRPGAAVYGAAKAGVENFGRSLAVELAPEAIRVNTVAPDNTPTPHMASRVPERYRRTVGRSDIAARAAQVQIPMGRAGIPQDVSNCVLFLASDLAGYVTGTTLRPDGGTWASSGWLNWPGAGFSPSPPQSVVETMFPPVPRDPR